MSTKKLFRNYVERAVTESLNWRGVREYEVTEIRDIKVEWEEGGVESDPDDYGNDYVRPPAIKITVVITYERIANIDLTPFYFPKPIYGTVELEAAEALTALMQALVTGEVEV